jgi:nitrite reductase/ring-hydroxylating ferredoxin subunit
MAETTERGGSMDWIKVMDVADIPADARVLRGIGGVEVLLVNHQGRIYALESKCPHLGGPLIKGRLTEDNLIICPRHHSTFKLETGEAVEWSPWPPVVGQALSAVRAERPLRVFPVRVDEGSVWVDMQRRGENS